MAAIVLDGKALAREIEAGLAIRVAALRERSRGEVPMLATILVGGDPRRRHTSK